MPPPKPWRNSVHPRNLTSLFRYLFPQTHSRLSNRLLDFRLDTLPQLKLSAQSRIYQAILRSQRRRRGRRLAGRNWSRFILYRHRKSLSRSPEDAGSSLPADTDSKTSMASSALTGDSRAPGQRRNKMVGYLRAANELRQSYQQSFSTRWQEDYYDGGMPGAFPDADIVRSGDEEMLLFPSYARKHTKTTHPSQEGHAPGPPGAHGDVGHPDPGDADYWRREWQKYEDENAVVDVDVRGWIYTPQRGPLNRRNRLMLAVARRLSGIPAPDTGSPSSQAGHYPYHQRVHDDLLHQEEEAAAKEAERLTRRGQREADAASKGKYSADNASLLDVSPTNSRSSSPIRPTSSRLNSDFDGSDTASMASSQHKQSSNHNSMTKEEIASANEQLMNRLRPFMTLPLTNTPITIFFYNDEKSQSKSVYTDDSGHFKVRAALSFVPDKVRVLASENLSATEDVFVTNSRGVSIVSDIDDTIKHSAIASGAKEIFKNTFLRDLGELVVPGVKEWYGKMASMGVKLHYVSNSPWQLYPLLRSYFALAGLPPGSFHLKQYSGMLQGIFEPAAERKKASLDRIMHDFPERKFILVGDSGEADLEVYTDIVQEHPNRVLAVFIRDVTSKEENHLKDFFYASSPTSASSRSPPSRSPTPQVSECKVKDEGRPSLPERPRPTSVDTDDLIDLSDDTPTTSKNSRLSYSTDLEELGRPMEKASPQNRPVKPAKPSNLRSFSTASPPIPPSEAKGSQNPRNPQGNGEIKRNNPPAPPAPRRSATSQSTNSTISPNTNSTGAVGERFASQVNKPPPPPPPPSRTLWEDSSHYSSPSARHDNTPADSPGYLASARHQLATAYNAIPPLRSQYPGAVDPANPNGPPLPPRRGLSSYPAAAARFVTGATGGDPAAGGDGGAPGQSADRKLEMWKRRWARSREIMTHHGVFLQTWRNGADVMDQCAMIVEKALRDIDTGRGRGDAVGGRP